MERDLREGELFGEPDQSSGSGSTILLSDPINWFSSRQLAENRFLCFSCSTQLKDSGVGCHIDFEGIAINRTFCRISDIENTRI